MKNTLIISHPSLQENHPVLQAVLSILGPFKYLNMDGEIDFTDVERILICAPAAMDTDTTIQWVSNHVDELCACPSVSLIELGGMEEGDSWAMDAQMQMRHPTSPGLAARLKEDDIEAAVDFALAIKTSEDQPDRKVPEAQLKSDVESFLTTHNTCTLTVNVPGLPQGTPLPYRYHSGHFYIFCESGILCAGLKEGQYGSVVVGDPHGGFAGLSGVQASGHCRLMQIDDAHFAGILKGFNVAQGDVQQMKENACLIDLRLQKGIFLWADYAESGFDPRQIYYFQ